MSRPDIPAEIRRAVLVESGHRCAIPRCAHSDVDIHHIIPWETCKKHEYHNLIALCPNCHRRAHLNEIDRKSLLIYKQQLIDSFLTHQQDQFTCPIIEIKRRMSEEHQGRPGYNFCFDFPDFKEPAERIVSKNIESWGNELLLSFREMQKEYEKHPEEYHTRPCELNGSYEIARRDKSIISIKYTLDMYYSGAAHGCRESRVQNFALSPFQPITLGQLLNSDDYLIQLSELVRNELLAPHERPRDRDSVFGGTEPDVKNFSLFTIGKFGIRFIFSEYQIGCYAEGEQEIWLSSHDLKSIVNKNIFDVIFGNT